MEKITKAKLERYFKVSKKAFLKAKKSKERVKVKGARKEILSMVENYLKDAEFFYKKGDYVNAFAALNYLHGWLDCGARLGIFDVHDSELFVED